MEKVFVGSIVIRAEGFELYKRALHVLSEARRVLLFKKASEHPSSTLSVSFLQVTTLNKLELTVNYSK
jgi:hypothetical protein